MMSAALSSARDTAVPEEGQPKPPSIGSFLGAERRGER